MSSMVDLGAVFVDIADPPADRDGMVSAAALLQCCQIAHCRHCQSLAIVLVRRRFSCR